MGGPTAPVTPEASAKGLVARIDKLSLATTGVFEDFLGKPYRLLIGTNPIMTDKRQRASPAPQNYVATDDLKMAVNAAITLERPLLIKGEPGTGKTVLAAGGRQGARRAADRVAHQVDHQGAAGPLRVRRGRRACATASSATRASKDIANYIKRGKLWDAFVDGRSARCC